MQETLPPSTLPHATRTLSPAGPELNLNLTHGGDLYMREKREGETGGERRQINKSEKEKQGSTEAGGNFILVSFLRVTQRGRQLGKLTWITTGQQEEEEGGGEGVWA